MWKAAMALALLLAACNSGPMDEADAAACDRYAATMQAAQNDEFGHDLEFVAELQRSRELAESERLRDRMGAVLDAAREGGADRDAINSVRSWCGLD